MIRVVIAGATGRMGSTLVRLVRDADDLELVGATEKPGAGALGIDVGLATRLGALEVTLRDDLARVLEMSPADVVIDFTQAAASVEHARICAKASVALVVGSTGFTADDRAAVAEAAKKTGIVMAPNMSSGVNVMLKLIEQTARVLGEAYEVEVVELHHRHKKDAPSGTALRLAEVAAQALGRSEGDLTFSRRGEVGERPRAQIGVQALRGGDVVGEHTVYFLGEGERLEITHRASSRDQFAAGALRAARWVAGKPPGLYDMQDVLGLK